MSIILHRPDHPPSLPLDRLPPAEHEAARALQQALRALPKYCEDFTAALKLFEYSEIGRAVGMHQSQAPVVATPPWSEVWLSTRWRLIAARDAAHTLVGFTREIEIIQRNLAACPTLASLLGEHADAASSAAAEGWLGPSLLGAQAQDGGGSTALTAGSHPDPAAPVFEEPELYNRSFTTDIGGRRLTYALTTETEARMGEIRSRLWIAFGALEEP